MTHVHSTYHFQLTHAMKFSDFSFTDARATTPIFLACPFLFVLSVFLSFFLRLVR